MEKAKIVGYTIIILSNIDKIHWKYSSKICKKLKLFDWIFLSCDHGFVKPDILFFAYFCHCFKIKKSEAVFIDDKSENIQAAQSLGIPSILYDIRKHKDFLAEFNVLYPDISLKY